MFYSASKKTVSYSSKTLSYLIKCMFLMCAFLIFTLFMSVSKVEAAVNFNYGKLSQSTNDGTRPCQTTTGEGNEITYHASEEKCSWTEWKGASYTSRSAAYTRSIHINIGDGTTWKLYSITVKVDGKSKKWELDKPYSDIVSFYWSSSHSSIEFSSDPDDHLTVKLPMTNLYSKVELDARGFWENGQSSFQLVDKAPPRAGTYKLNGGASYSKTTNVSVSSSFADDNTIYYCMKETTDATLPGSSDSCWTTTKPTSFTLSSSQGQKTVYYFYKDSLGNYSYSSKTIYYDNTAPKLVVNAPASGSIQGSGTSSVYYGQSEKNVVIKFTDNVGLKSYSSTSYYRYKWCTSSSSCDESWVSVNSVKGERALKSVTGTITTPKNEGTYYLWIEGTGGDNVDYYVTNDTNIDGLGSDSNGDRKFKFVIDNTPPVLTISLSTNISVLNNNGNATYSTNGGGEDIVGWGQYVVQSSNSLKISFSDNYGIDRNYAKWSRCISSTNASCKVENDVTDGGLITFSYFLDGINHVRIYAGIYDYAGNVPIQETSTPCAEQDGQYWWYWIIIDDEAPTITSFTLTGNSDAQSGYTKQKTVTANITVTDNEYTYAYGFKDSTTALGVEYKTAWESVSYTKELTLNNGDGSHTITLTLIDRAGNIATATATITLDTVNPTISTFTATGNSDAVTGYTKQTSVTYSITASDTTSGVKYYKVDDGNSNINSQSSNKPTSGTLYGTTQGKHTLTLTITDKAGNVATKTYDITYDSTAPVISKFEAKGNVSATCGYTNTTSITYVGQCSSSTPGNIVVSDEHSAVRYYKVEDGSSVIYAQSESVPTTDTLANTNAGNHVLTLTITDSAGNTQTKTYTIYYDSTAPTASTFNVIGNTAATAGYTNTRSVTFEITGSDANAGVREYVVLEGNSILASTYNTGSTFAAPTSGTLSSATQGTHTLTLSVVDFAGNEATKTFSIILDTTAPVISSFTYSGNEGAMAGYTNQQSISYALNVTEANFKSGSVTPYNTSGTACSANAKTITSKSSSGTINLCNTTNGTHKLKVSVLDYAGNETSLNNNQIILDTVAPVLSLTTSLSPSLPAKSGTATITYTEAYPRATMTGKTLRYVLTTNSASTANISCTAVTATTLTQTNCFGSGTLANSSTNVYTIALTLSPTTSGTYYLRVLDENLATDMAGNAVSSPVSKVSMKINNESVSTYVFGGYLIDQTAPTLSLNLGNGSYNGSGTSAIHYSKTSASITVKFTDNMYLANYSSTSAFRYCWSTTKSCSSWTAITGTRTKTEVSGTITVPSTIGTHYLIIEGATAKDYAGWYATNSYLNETRTSTSSDNRIFKFVTDNTNGSLIINYTKVSNTYYAKPNITTNIYYSDTISLRNYSGTTNYMYAWSKASTSISGWDQTYLKKMPSKSSTRISGIKTPTAEGVWYLMLYGLSTDAAGNSITAPTTYGSANVQYSDGLTQTVTAKVYRFIIDGTNPEIVLEHGENKYYGIHSDSSIGELKVGDTVKLGYVEANTRNIPANTNVKYYISSKANDLSSSISSGLVGYDDNTMVFGEEFKIMNYMSGYYIHFFVENGSSSYDLLVTDYAGNNMSKDTTRTYSGYYVVTFFITPLAASTSQLEAIDEAIIPDSSSVNGNKYLIQSRKYIILTINNQDTTRMTLSSIVSALGVRLISAYNGVGEELVTHPYLDLVIKGSSGNVYSHIAIVIFNNAPRLIISNNNPTAVVKQGEEISNVGMSFVSSDGSKVSVDTLITLDGVKVKSVDTNVPGVYNVTQVAKDEQGRTTKVNKEIVVLANKEVKEEVVSEELVEEVKGIIALPVEVNVTSEQVEETTNIEVVERHIELELENKSKVKGYKKKKENKKIKKEHDNSKVLVKSREIINVRHV